MISGIKKKKLSKRGKYFLKIDSFELHWVSLYRFTSNNQYEQIKQWRGPIDEIEYMRLRYGYVPDLTEPDLSWIN